MITRGLTLVDTKQCTVLPHITASVFMNDDEYGLIRTMRSGWRG
jgi:hypothetical protein